MPEREAVDLRWLLAVIRRWLWLIILCALLGLGGAYGASRYMPPVYSASSTLLIQAAVTDFQAIMTSERLARTYSQLLKEQTVMEMVIQQLGLDETPVALARKVKVNVVADTQLIRVNVEHKDPSLAAQIANALSNAFIEQVEIYQTERYSESLTSIKEQIDELATLMDTTQAKIDVLGTPTFPDDQLELARLEGLQAQYRGAYTSLLQGYEQMRLSAAQSFQTVVVAETARVPREPTQNLFLYMSLAGLVGLMVGVGAAFLLEYLDDTIKSAEDVRRVLGLRVLGAIGTLSRSQRNAIVATEVPSAHGEAYRVLGTNLFYSGAEVPLRSILVTSPTASEGKTITAANLAVALAQSGLRVSLVEADLRRPTLGRLFGIEPHTQGLSGALEQGKIDGQLQKTAVEGLTVLDSGELPSNPARLLGSQHMEDLLDDLARRSDVVVVDSPPVLPVADAMLLARQANGVLMVLRAGQTRWQAARQAVDRLRQVGANVVGVALNGVPTRKGGYYGGYYDSGYYASNGNGHDTGAGWKAGASARKKDASAATRGRGLASRLFGRLHKGEPALASPLAPGDGGAPAPQAPSSGDGETLAAPAPRAEPPSLAQQPPAERSLAQTRLLYLFLGAMTDPSAGTALLCAWGIGADGRYLPLLVEPGDRESARDWSALLDLLRERGGAAPLLVIAERRPALVEAIRGAFPHSLRQCCLTHKVNQVALTVPPASRAEIRAVVQAAYLAPDRRTADLLASSLSLTYGAAFPAMIEAFWEDWEACVAYLRCPRAHHKRIRTVALVGRALREARRAGALNWSESDPSRTASVLLDFLVRASERWQGVPVGKAEIEHAAALRAELGLTSQQLALDLAEPDVAPSEPAMAADAWTGAAERATPYGGSSDA